MAMQELYAAFAQVFVKGVNKLSEKIRTLYPVPGLDNIKTIKSKRFRLSHNNKGEAVRVNYSECTPRFLATAGGGTNPAAYRHLLSKYIPAYNECISNIEKTVELAVRNKKQGERTPKSKKGIAEEAAIDVDRLISHANYCYSSYRLRAILYVAIFSAVRLLKEHQDNIRSKAYKALMFQQGLVIKPHPAYTLPYLEKGENTPPVPPKPKPRGNKRKGHGSSTSKNRPSNTRRASTNSKRNEGQRGAAEAIASGNDVYIGRKVSKYFENDDGQGDWYQGEVVGVEELDGQCESFYHVRYEDGDEEDLQIADLEEILCVRIEGDDDNDSDDMVSEVSDGVLDGHEDEEDDY